MNDNMTGRLSVRPNGAAAYEIWYRASFDDLPGALKEAGLADRRVLLVTDSNVSPLYEESVKNALSAAAAKVLVHTLPAGEKRKDLDTLSALLLCMAREGFDRTWILAALGGGAVCDLTGFASAVYLQGVDYIRIPTTLLSQADSAMEGRAFADCGGCRDRIGAVCMPRLIYNNVSVLKTLDGPSFASGFAYVMNLGIIGDADHYVRLLENMYEILDLDSDTLQAMLLRCGEIRKNLEEKGPGGKDRQCLLSFGRTIGEAIGRYKQDALTEGACLALGSICAAWISWQKGYLNMDEYYEIRDMFVPFGLPISDADLDPAAIAALVPADRGTDDGRVPLVLLKKIGRAFVDDTVTLSEIEDALRQIHWTEDGE